MAGRGVPTAMKLRACAAAAVILVAGGCTTLRQAIQNRPCVLDPQEPYATVTIDLTRHTIALYWRNPETGRPFETINALRTWMASRGDTALVITNAGIFEPGLLPTGLYIERGRQLRPVNTDSGYGNFYLKPNGIFLIGSDGAAILETSRFDSLAIRPEYAIQSGPLLLSDSAIHPVFRPDSENCRLRSGIGVGPDGTMTLAITNGAVNFYNFARWFRDTAGVADALYLDGAISELYTPDQPATSNERFAAFLVVTPRE